MSEYIFTLGDPVFNAETREAVFKPEVVGRLIRCRDCKYQNKGENESESWNLCGYRPWLYIPTSDDHFCGYGERGEADDD